jgi:hypothetical protein
VELRELDRYGFLEVQTSHDHAVAIGSTVILNFNFPQLNENANLSMHALHVYDRERSEKRRKNVMDMITSV